MVPLWTRSSPALAADPTGDLDHGIQEANPHDNNNSKCEAGTPPGLSVIREPRAHKVQRVGQQYRTAARRRTGHQVQDGRDA